MTLKKWTVNSLGEGSRIVEELQRVLKISGKQAKGLLDRKEVFVSGRRVWLSKFLLKEGNKIEVRSTTLSDGCSSKSEVFGVKNSTPAIIWKDENCLVVNKPAGLLSCSEQVRDVSSHSILIRDNPGNDIFPVHRLDKDTSGCLLYALNRESLSELEGLFRSRKVSKTYLAIVSGSSLPQSGRIASEIDGKKAVSTYSVLAKCNRASLVEVKPETGRMHQIRKHLATLKHPILGDKTYQSLPSESNASRKAPRQMLHALSVSLSVSWHAKLLSISAPIPEDFLSTLKELGIDKYETEYV